MTLLMAQPKTEIASNVVATAWFDPPMVRPGESAVYRATFNALEESIVWPEKVAATAGLDLRAGGRGQILQFNGTNFVPRTTYNYNVRAPGLGTFSVPAFGVSIYGKTVTVPAAQLIVAAAAPPSIPPAQRLVLEASETNVYVGQPVKVRVVLAASPSGQLQTLMQVQVNGEGVLVDQGTARQQVTRVRRGPVTVLAYLYETVLTPLKTGRLSVFAQGYSAGSRVMGPVPAGGAAVPVASIFVPFTLLDSDPVELHTRPLPRQGELPGFTGAIGSFTLDPPSLAASILRVGETVRLAVTVHGDGNMGRLAPPPPPQSRQWQIFAGTTESLPQPPYAVFTPQPAVPPAPSATFVYTLVPLTAAATATPAIPFSYFDPKRAAYVDLTIPSLAVTVEPSAAGADLAALQQPDVGTAEAQSEPGLSPLASAPGLAAASLVPVQRRPWFSLLQLAPAAVFAALWAWDRRRRFLEQHPEVILRRRARRALRREWRALRRAARAGDAPRFANAAVAALRVACAPHFPAEPRALVGADVLPLLPPDGALPGEHRPIEVVRRFFALTDAARFGPAVVDTRQLMALRPELEQVLQRLEERLEP